MAENVVDSSEGRGKNGATARARPRLAFKPSAGAHGAGVSTPSERKRDILAEKKFHYRWEFDLKASPQALWPFVADTNRFNRDAGLPDVTRESMSGANGRRRLRLSKLGVGVEW